MGDFEKEQARLLRLYEEVQSDICSGSEDGEDQEMENTEEENCNLSEEENVVEDNLDSSEEEEAAIPEIDFNTNLFYLGKDKSTKWFKIPSVSRKNVKLVLKIYLPNHQVFEDSSESRRPPWTAGNCL